MSTSSKSEGSSDKISVGYVSSAHGVKGELKVVPLTDYPDRFRGMHRMNLYRDGVFLRVLAVKNIRMHEGKGEWIVESDLECRNEAEPLVGATIMVSPQERVDLPEDFFWVDDLIGLDVRDMEGNLLGTVSDFFAAGGHETYEVCDDNGASHYIPAVPQFVKNIDLDSKTITVELIEGLW